MIDPVTLNARKPRDDEYGHAMLNRMNERHQRLHEWGLEHIALNKAETILDVGFGGGQNIRNMGTLLPRAKICGIDYSEASYKKCAELNREAIQNGSVEIQVGTAERIPYEPETFDLVTAFETVYYWPHIVECFRSVRNVLKKNGIFLICNEDSSLTGNEEIAKTLNMNFYGRGAFERDLRLAGFETVHVYEHTNGRWICAVAIR